MATIVLRRTGPAWEPLIASPPTSFKLKIQPQDQCPLFSPLPAELRILIFEYTLTDYESTDYFYRYGDPGRPRGSHIRRDYRPRRSTATQLLRTCQRVYCETWLMPFILAEHIFYVFAFHPFTNSDTQDAEKFTISLERMEKYLQILKEYASSHDQTLHLPHIQSIRLYFEQSMMGHPNVYLGSIIQGIPKEFQPKCVTFSLNYKNSFMKDADGYNISAQWVNQLRFPNSVTRIRMELGKFSNGPPLRQIVSEVVSKWFFRREDGVVFRAAEDDVFYRPWIANEATHSQAPRIEKLYIIPMVTWRPAGEFDPFADGYECPDLNLTSLARRLDRMPLGDITGAFSRLSAHG